MAIRPIPAGDRMDRAAGSGGLRRSAPAAVMLLLAAAANAGGEGPASAAVTAPAGPGPLASPPPIVALHLQCAGRDPAWQLAAGPDNAVLSRPGTDAPLRQETYRGRTTALSFLDPAWTVWRGVSTREPGRTLVLTMRREACVDTVAEAPPQDGRAVISLPDAAVLAGCCRATFGYDLRRVPLADATRKPPGDWSHRLPALAPALRACTNDAGLSVAAVTHARPLDGGRAGVRLVDLQGRVHDCVADVAQRRVRHVSPPAADAPALPGDGEPRFFPAREAMPVIACGRVERAADAGGRTLGWLRYGDCRAEDAAAARTAPR
jgi:hypothetical protein